MTPNELKATIAAHTQWLKNPEKGKRLVLPLANLRDANLPDSNLTGAYLYGADLTRADLTRADLTRADLTRANLTRANLTGANLSGANLAGADLSGANLYGADLYGADLTRANLTGADLAESKGLKFSQCSFSAHGETGRRLTAAVITGETRLFCGCFQGSEKELRDYIENGKEEHKASRLAALNFCLETLNH